MAHAPERPLFVGSAVKTFILTRFLQATEEGSLSEDTMLPVDDSVRALVSPVFGALSGEAPARVALEAMICHSDNTATDICLRATGAAKVRSFIAQAGLSATRIPDSTRILFSYLAGAPAGVDEGWPGMQRITRGELFGALACRSTMRRRWSARPPTWCRITGARYGERSSSSRAR
ncbi:MAG: serine hydrolase [Acetobacteraceae bacterium]